MYYYVFMSYFLIEQFYIRKLQDEIKINNKYKEWILFLINNSIIKIVIFIPLLFLNLGVITLIIEAFIILMPILEIFSTWIYINSNKNPLITATFNLLLLSWLLNAIMPFGTIFLI